MSKGVEGFPEGIAGTISPETARRIAGREKLLVRFCELVESAAKEHGTQVEKVSIRPAWSHEYDERTGLTVDVGVIASDDARFAYWEALNDCLDKLAESLPPVDRNWLEDEVSITVIRSLNQSLSY